MSTPSASDKDRRGVKWDEDNLEENERIKKELNPRKIDEPKTPYLSMSPMETDDEVDAMSKYFDTTARSQQEALEEAAATATAAVPIRATKRNASAWSDSSDHNSNRSPSPRVTIAVGGAAGSLPTGHSPRFSEEYYRDDSDDDNSDNPEKLEKKKKFKEARKKHYHMEFMFKNKGQLSDEINNEEDELAELELGDGEEQQQQQQQQQQTNVVNDEKDEVSGANDDGDIVELIRDKSNGITMSAPNQSIL